MDPVIAVVAPRRAVDALRHRARAELRGRVVGPHADRRRAEIFDAVGPRRFGPDDPIWRVHADASMFVGGLRALLLQSLHPVAMRAVAEHSGYRGDPWGRLQRTADFVAATTYGTEAVADAAIARVRSVHRTVRGRTVDGQAYRADDPHLLEWVHIAEIDSFLVAVRAPRRRHAVGSRRRSVRGPDRRRRCLPWRDRPARDPRRAPAAAASVPRRAPEHARGHGCRPLPPRPATPAARRSSCLRRPGRRRGDLAPPVGSHRPRRAHPAARRRAGRPTPRPARAPTPCAGSPSETPARGRGPFVPRLSEH